MFWGCFAFDRKGPSHIWRKETAAEKKKADDELELWNEVIEVDAIEQWESAMLQREIARKPGKKPTWRFTEKTGKLVRKSKAGGIDWYRYQKEILKPKMFPFVNEISGGIVMEDRAAPHAHQFQGKLFEAEGIQ